MNKQLSVISIKMEIDIGMPSNNLTQRSGIESEEQRVKDRALWQAKQQLIQF